ncbi:hypothetical protein JTB14_031523 [Gonioctena quinquepunctata]|nr:hypothetical protein JTB14_031523 [Gonioctena quinquepunctata]
MSVLAAKAPAAKMSPDLHAQFKARSTHLEDIYQEFENQNATLAPLLIAADTYNNDEFKTLSRNFYQYYYRAKSTFSSLFDADHDPNSSSIQDTSQIPIRYLDLRFIMAPMEFQRLNLFKTFSYSNVVLQTELLIVRRKDCQNPWKIHGFFLKTLTLIFPLGELFMLK